MPEDLSNHEDKGLQAMYDAYLDKMGTFVSGNQPFWTSRMGVRSGTLSNLEAGLAYMASLGNTSLSGGCVSMQAETARVLRAAATGGWIVEEIRIGSNVMGHSAVAVYPGGSSMEQGYVFDPWLRQSPLVFDFEEWQGHFRIMSIMGGARRQ